MTDTEGKATAWPDTAPRGAARPHVGTTAVDRPGARLKLRARSDAGLLSHAWLAVVLVLGAALRFAGLGFGLPHDLARPDEEKIILAALGVAGGDLNPHLFLYPSLFIYAVAAAYAAVFAIAGGAVSAVSYAAGLVSNPSLLHLVPRALAAAAGLATIGVLWAAARELLGARTAAIAAFFVAVAYLHVRDSHFGTTDVPVTLLVACAFWAATRCVTRGAIPRRAALAGLACGLAASTKYNAVLVIAPALVAVAGGPLFDRRRPTRGEILASAIVVACAVAGYLAATPFTLLDWPGFAAQFSEQRRIFSGLQNGSIIGPARQVLGGERGWLHYARFTLPHGVGLPLLLTSLCGSLWLLVRRPREALLVLSFPLLYYASMGLGQLVYARNMVPVVPFVCLTAATIVPEIRSGRLARNLFSATLVLLIAAPTFAQSLAFDRLMAREDTRVLGGRWLQAHFPAEATIYQTGIFYGHLQPVPRSRYARAAFDGRRSEFVDSGGNPTSPDVVVRLDSPLSVYSQVPSGLDRVLARDYVLAQIFRARAPGRQDGLYDQQDAWYAPFAGISAALRPGPDVFIYARRPGADD